MMPDGSSSTKVGCMSMIESDVDAQALEPGESPAIAADASLPRFEAPIVPTATIAGRALIAVVAIMTFLASLTIGGVFLVLGAASDWQSDLAREVTIQVRPVSGRDIEADVGQAAAIARAATGIAGVRPYSNQESMQLLQPWLDGLALDELPVPRIVAVEIAPGEKPDFGRLRQALADEVPPASLDDHRGFIDHMRAMTQAVLAGGAGVLALVMIATILSVAFATRGVIATNRQVVEVLHFIGARNNFIAAHFQRHFLLLGLKGGAVGGGFAILLFAFAGLASRSLADTPEAAELAASFGTLSVGTAGYIAVLAQIVLTALVTAATSRYAVNRMLDSVQ
jgi:cell division transport system permease protein